MIRDVSIQIKVILSVIFFVLILVSIERYEISRNIQKQFIESKKEKNKLFTDTIAPIIGLNISLGLEGSNIEYLNTIVKQNHDILDFKLTSIDGRILFHYTKRNPKSLERTEDGIHNVIQSINDPLTKDKVAVVTIYFDDHQYQTILRKNSEITIKIFMIELLGLIAFIIYIRQEFKFLNKLSEYVLKYDPQKNSVQLSKTDRKDEVGLINNAIATMVQKISSYTLLLDDLNQSLSIKVKERTKELEEANERLNELSMTDPLTQLPNRRYLENNIQSIWEFAKRNQVMISVVMCDIDYFKQVNDTYGHIIGDFVLQDIAQVLKSTLKRKSDFVARYGGEEFIIVLYDTDINGAEELCIDIQNNLRSELISYQDVSIEPITLSFGISCVTPDEMSSFAELINLADLALYQAKKTGRNRFVSINN